MFFNILIPDLNTCASKDTSGSDPYQQSYRTVRLFLGKYMYLSHFILLRSQWPLYDYFVLNPIPNFVEIVYGKIIFRKLSIMIIK